MHIFWDYTKHCNLNCVHCYNAPERRIAPPDLSTAARLDVVDQLCERFPGAELHFLGGEPLSSPDFIEVADRARSRGLELEVTTNGTYSSPELVIFIKTNFARLHLSVDGHASQVNDRIRGQGVFDSLIKFITCWNDQPGGCNFDLTFCLSSESIKHPYELVDFALKHRFDSLTIQPMKLIGNAAKGGDKFAISAADYFEFGENIARASVGEPIRVQLTGGSARYKDYIKWTYFTDIVSVDKSCGSGKRQLRLSSTGTAMPCVVGSLAPLKLLNDWKVDSTTNSVSQVVGKGSFQKYAAANQQRAQEDPLHICRDCSHLKAGECYAGCPVQKSFGPARLCLELARRGSVN